MIGLTPRAKFGNCASQSGNEVESIMDWANKAGFLHIYYNVNTSTSELPNCMYERFAKKCTHTSANSNDKRAPFKEKKWNVFSAVDRFE